MRIFIYYFYMFKIKNPLIKKFQLQMPSLVIFSNIFKKQIVHSTLPGTAKKEILSTHFKKLIDP